MFFKKIYEPLNEAIENIGFQEPTPIQKESFSVIKSGESTLLIAGEKSGKTTALVMAIIQRLKEEVADIPRAIVLVQNTEHGEEVEEIFKQLAKYTDLRIYRTYKGADILKQRDAIYAGCDVVIGTAKRLNEIYIANGLNYRDLLIYAIDNAEKVVKPEVVIQVDKLTDRMPKCQHILASTKETSGIDRYVERYLNSVKVVKLA